LTLLPHLLLLLHHLVIESFTLEIGFITDRSPSANAPFLERLVSPVTSEGSILE
jgi:hypothetical protein